jgi:hypothetical protein
MNLPTSPINRAQGLGEEGGLAICYRALSLSPLASHIGKTYPNIGHEATRRDRSLSQQGGRSGS